MNQDDKFENLLKVLLCKVGGCKMFNDWTCQLSSYLERIALQGRRELGSRMTQDENYENCLHFFNIYSLHNAYRST